MSTGRHGLLDTILTISMFFIEDPGPDLPPAGQADVDQVQSLLRDLHKALISLLTATRGTSQEAKAWLINAIAALGVRDPGLRRRKFAQFLPGGSAYDRDAHAEFAAQLLQGLFADEPQKVARLLAAEPAALRRFFRSDTSAVRLWFGHFSMEGMREFKHGALALARYALQRRDEAWRLLAWAGKHPQAPVAVAARTHYFCELDVPATVANFLEDCPEFWESQELRESMQGGQLLQLAPGFWAQELQGWLKEYSARSDRLYGLVCDYLESGADWRRLCGRLLHLLPPADLVSFAGGLLEGVAPPPAAAGTVGSSAGGAGGSQPAVPAGAWLVFGGLGSGNGGSSVEREGGGSSSGQQWGSMEELLAAAAVGCSLRQLGRMVREEEHAEALQAMQGLAETLQRCESPAAHWRLRRRLARLQAGRGEWQPLHSFLLMHLWAAYLRLQQLAAVLSSPAPAAPAAAVGEAGAGRAEAEQFQRLVEASGLACRPAAAAGETAAGAAGAARGEQAGGEPAGAGAEEGEEEEDPLGPGWKRRRWRRRGAKEERRRRRSGSRGGGRKRKRSPSKSAKKRKRKKGRRHKRRRRGSNDGSPSSSSSSSDSESSSDSGGGAGGLAGLAGRYGGGLSSSVGAGAQQSLWVVQAPGQKEVVLSAMELADCAMEQAAEAYAVWLFGGSGRRS